MVPQHSAAAFIRAHTRLTTVHAVPEIRLRLAFDDSIDLWEAAQEAGGAAGSAPPFWAFAWPGGVALARHLLDVPETARGRRVIDVACGSGLVAIAAALAGATDVRAIDVDHRAVTVTRMNAADNHVRVSAEVGDVVDLVAGPGDLVVAGDVFYDRAMADRMGTALRAAKAVGANVLVGDPLREYLPGSGLTVIASYDLDVDPELEGAPTKHSVVASVD